MIPCLPGISLILLVAASAYAEVIPPESVDWQTIRTRQPEGLNLKLELPGTAFHQGEVIDATLTFANTSATAYHLWASTGDRSGRIPDIAFYAIGSDGKPAPDPLRWYFERGGMGGGLGSEQDLGEWQITLPVNQWLSFTKPGSYKLFAYSNRVQKGDQFTRGNPQENRVELVSDPVTITVDPLTPAEEQRILAEASGSLTAGGEQAEAAAAALRYLGTPAAREAALALLNTSQSFAASMAFYAAPDPTAEAPAILAAVRDGKLKLDQNVIFLYQTLKTAGFRITPSDNREELERLAKRCLEASQAAADEITKVATAATGGKGPDYYETLLLSLHRDPGKRAQMRSELVDAQLELTPEQADSVIQGWNIWGGEDFLPLLRKAVGAPAYNPNALKVLARIKPDEARPLIIEDLQREPHRYLIPKAGSGIANAPLLSLPAVPIPELEPFFREKLAANRRGFDLLLSAIDRYGTPALLPDVLKFYLPKEGRWACAIQNAALRFWIRNDAPDGIEALSRALRAREKTGCYRRVLSDVLLDQWAPSALPLVSAALDDPDPDVVISAITVLEHHADGQWLAPSIAALQRISTTITKDNHRYSVTLGGAQRLLESTRWTLEANQRRQLQKIASHRPN